MTRYTTRREGSRWHLYRGESKAATFWKASGEELLGRVPALLNAADRIPNCPEMDNWLRGRILPDFITFQLWKAICVERKGLDLPLFGAKEYSGEQ